MGISPHARYAHRMTIIAMPDRTGRLDVAAEVRAQLARRRVRPNHLPRLIGKSQSYWSRRVNGAQPFDTDGLLDLAQLLNVHPAMFFGLDTPPPVDPIHGAGGRKSLWIYGSRAGSSVTIGPWVTMRPSRSAAA